MSRTYWIGAFVLAGLVATALLIGGWVQFLEYGHQHSDQRQDVATYEAPTNHKYADSCLGEPVTLSSFAKCIIQSVDANREAQRAKYDLQAQQEMAEWGFALVLLTIAQSIVSIVGIVLLVRNLTLAREANQVSRTIGEAQVRAYLRCKSAKYKRSKDQISATLELENAGQSPAQEVVISGTVTIHDIGGHSSAPRVLAWCSSKEEEVSCEPVISGSTVSQSIVFFLLLDFADSGDEWPIKKAVFETGNQVWFDLAVHWTDVFNQRQSFSVDLSANMGPSPYEPRRKTWSNSGKLHLNAGDSQMIGPSMKNKNN